MTLGSALGAWVSPQVEDLGGLPNDLETTFVPPCEGSLSFLPGPQLPHLFNGDIIIGG